MSEQLNVCTVWYELVVLQELQLVGWYEDGSGGKALEMQLKKRNHPKAILWTKFAFQEGFEL